MLFRRAKKPFARKTALKGSLIEPNAKGVLGRIGQSFPASHVAPELKRMQLAGIELHNKKIIERAKAKQKK